MPIPVIPLALGAGAMYALNEQEKAKKAEEAKGFDFLSAFSKAVPAAIQSTIPGLNFIQGLGKLGSSVFGPSEKTAQASFVEDTANSPAMQSGAFTNDELWQQKLKHEEWKKSQGRNYNKDYERYF